jgi:hypothetical protein
MTGREEEGGCCPICEEPARWRECSICGKGAWIIDCGHQDQPRPIAHGRTDGSQGHRLFCEDCAEEEVGS